MTNLKIAILEGDDIGHEIIPMAKNVIIKALNFVDYNYDLIELPIGKLAHNKYGDTFPNFTRDELKKVDAVICGPFGHNSYPRNDSTWRIPPIRKALDLYASVRPIKSYLPDSNIDLIFVREVTEGLLSAETVIAGQAEYRPNDEITIASRVITRRGSRRVAECAFDIARHHGRKKVTVSHKEPVYRLSCGMFLEECQKTSKEYPNILMDDKLIDTTAMHLVSAPEGFDVIVTTNQFGDILSDLGAGLIGSIGMAPGLCIGQDIAMAQTTHGSAPDIVGKNIANPYAIIMSSAMLINWLGFKNNQDKLIDASNNIINSLEKVITSKKNLTPDIGGNATTLEMTNEILLNLESNT
tara:strand:+ start:24923 stop:25984 length:1062 start_codon:yes stop_codon:yes gene_type:complete